MSVDYKIILIGNSGVGKTSIFRKLDTGEFNEGTISTIGVEKKTMDISLDVEYKGKKEKKKFNIYFYDTAGQEKFRAITKNYYKGSDGIILMYDITKRESFDNVGAWIESIKDSIGKLNNQYTVILLGNKLDLIDTMIGNLKFKREVTEKEAIEICNNNNLVWGGEHSTKTIEYNDLKKLFESYIQKIYESVGPKIMKAQKNKKIDKYKPKRGSCCQTLQ